MAKSRKRKGTVPPIISNKIVKKIALNPKPSTSKQKAPVISPAVNVPTTNIYNPLTDNPNEILIDQSHQRVKPPRIPPITIIDCNRTSIYHILHELNITGFQVKLLKHGLNVYCKDSNDFQKATLSLSNSGIKF